MRVGWSESSRRIRFSLVAHFLAALFCGHLVWRTATTSKDAAPPIPVDPATPNTGNNGFNRIIVLLAVSACLSILPRLVQADTLGGPKRIGVAAISVSEHHEQADAFRDGLHAAGYVEGRDIVIDWWHGKGSYDHVSDGVARLIQRKVDVIVVEGTPAALAAKRATTTIPIVMALVGDPVGSGVVPNLAHTGGNVTGLTNQTVDLAPKRLQLLMEAVPEARRVAVIFNSDTPYTTAVVGLLKAVAPDMRAELTFHAVRTADELRSVLSRLNRSNAHALLVLDDAFMTPHGEMIIDLASKARLPVSYADKGLARRGVLISYAVEHSDLFRRAAVYVDKILKGAKPADLPIEQPTNFELVVNLKTAKALGITIPQSILLRADEVIR